MSNRIAGLRKNRGVWCAPRVCLLRSWDLSPCWRRPHAFAIGEDEFLQPEDAFKYTATADEQNVTIEWRATKGYYLYKKRMGLAAATPGVTVGESVYPKGEIHKDEYFGEQEIFRGTFKVTAPLTGAKAGDTVALKLKWQGCADAGLCYPPSVWDATVKVVAASAHHLGRQNVRARETRRSKAKRNISTSTRPSCSRARRCRSTTCSSTGASPTATTSTSSASRSSRPDDTKAIGALVLPKGESHSDEYFGEQEIYRQSLDATFSVPPSDAKTVDVNVTYQGCADAGLCYPPQTKLVSISLEGAPAATAARRHGGCRRLRLRAGQLRREDQERQYLPRAAVVLRRRAAAGVHALRAADGADPLGHHRRQRRERDDATLVHAVGGLRARHGVHLYRGGHRGRRHRPGLQSAGHVQPALDRRRFSACCSWCSRPRCSACSPSKCRASSRRGSASKSNEQQAGTYLGVGVMGALSALIVSACVAPPLIAALTVISQTGDVVRGGAALFVMSIGMGTPLLLVGASAGKLLPRAGAWMDTVKNLFGVLFLAVAAWMLARIVPDWLHDPLGGARVRAGLGAVERARRRAGAQRMLIARTRRGVAGSTAVVVYWRRPRAGRHQSAGADPATRRRSRRTSSSSASRRSRISSAKWRPPRPPARP